MEWEPGFRPDELQRIVPLVGEVHCFHLIDANEISATLEVAAPAAKDGYVCTISPTLAMHEDAVFMKILTDPQIMTEERANRPLKWAIAEEIELMLKHKD